MLEKLGITCGFLTVQFLIVGAIADVVFRWDVVCGVSSGLAILCYVCFTVFMILSAWKE